MCYLVHSIDSYKYCLSVDYNFWSCTEQDVCSKGVHLLVCLLWIVWEFKLL
jgi:hypothetical protein